MLKDDKKINLLFNTVLWVIVKKSSPKNLSADCRSTVGRQSADSRPTVGRLLADSRPTVGRLSADSWPTDGRQVLPEI